MHISLIMNVKLYGLLSFRNSYCLPTLYGYTTKGLPGIEIIGLGSMGRVLKEKIIFITRELGKKYPMRRYVLSIEGLEEFNKNEQKELKNLELGFLILFWKLADIVSISGLEKSLCSGQINVHQELITPAITNDIWDEIDNKFGLLKTKATLIGPEIEKKYDHIREFPIKCLLEQLASDE